MIFINAKVDLIFGWVTYYKLHVHIYKNFVFIIICFIVNSLAHQILQRAHKKQKSHPNFESCMYLNGILAINWTN